MPSPLPGHQGSRLSSSSPGPLSARGVGVRTCVSGLLPSVSSHSLGELVWPLGSCHPHPYVSQTQVFHCALHGSLIKHLKLRVQSELPASPEAAVSQPSPSRLMTTSELASAPHPTCQQKRALRGTYIQIRVLLTPLAGATWPKPSSPPAWTTVTALSVSLLLASP